MKLPLNDWILLIALLCLAPDAPAQVTLDASEMARQIAAKANDNAVSREEREETLKKLQESVRLFLSGGETVEAARVLNRVGRLHLLLNAPQDALNSHNQALTLLEQTPSLEAEVDNLNGIAEAHMLLQHRESAEETLNKSLRLSEQSGYTLGQAQALLTLSNRQNYDNHAIALETAKRALALWQNLGDKPGLARTYAQVGQYYMAQNILPEAIQNYEQALGLWREFNNSAEQAGTLIMLGFIEIRKAEWQSAISLLTQAQGLIDEKAEPKKMGQIAAGLAELHNEHGLPEVGVNHYQQALTYYRRTQDPHLVWYATWGLGYTYYLSQKYAEALAQLEQALAAVAKDSIEAGSTAEYIGRVRIATGEYPAALQSLQFALETYERTVNPKEAARVRGLMGQVYQYQGRLVSARRMYRQSLEIFDKFSDRVNQGAIYYAMGRLELKVGNYDAAEDYLRRSLEVTENMRQVSTSRDLTVAFSASVHERYQNYVECLMRKHQMAPAEGLNVRAFETSESARARSLAEFLRTTQTNFAPGLDPHLAQQEKSLRQSLRLRSEYRARLLSSTEKKYRTEDLVALDAELTRLEAEYKEVTETIQARYPAYEQITRPVAWDLQRIQREVIADDQTVLLEYSLGAEKSYLWAVTHNSIRSFEIPAEGLINDAAKKVYELLAVRPDAETEKNLSQASQELSRMVLSPVAAELNKPRVVVVADGALNYIPFQILPSLSVNNELLVGSHEVINAPSAFILGELQQEAARRRPATKVLAAFGDPIFASDYAQRKDANASGQLLAHASEDPRWRSTLRDIEINGDSFDPSVVKRLLYAKRELANLRELARGEALVVSEFDATRERLLGSDLTQYAMLHLATHGFLNPKRPEYSGFVLSTVDRDGKELSGFVGLREIYELRAPVALVVLSACQTALGKDVRGEGLVGLTRGFMYAGASGVVATLWKVEDEATAELMRLFYSNLLQKGMTPGVALREAQNSIRQRPEWSAPYYWAAFTLQGHHRQGIQATSSAGNSGYRRIIAGAVVLALLAGAAWWFYRRRQQTSHETA